MNTKLSRKDFIKTAGVIGGAALLVDCKLNTRITPEHKDDYPLNNVENIIYSTCLQCNTSCPIKVKIVDGVISKIDGNPYSMQTINPSIPYKSNIKDASKIDGGICPKGQAGIQTLYDPYRIVKVLKRAGKRGENKWEVISFEQAINEIVEGGKLFAKVRGEENRVVPGLKDLYKLKDHKVMKDMANDAKEVGKGKMSLEVFKQKYKDYLDTLIDPDMPDL